MDQFGPQLGLKFGRIPFKFSAINGLVTDDEDQPLKAKEFTGETSGKQAGKKKKKKKAMNHHCNTEGKPIESDSQTLNSKISLLEIEAKVRRGEAEVLKNENKDLKDEHSAENDELKDKVDKLNDTNSSFSKNLF
ncbi:unnamed protein product [Calypogeia fissa]